MGIAAVSDEALEPADVRPGHLGVALEREDERDVDRPALRDHVLDRRKTGLASRGSSRRGSAARAARGSAPPARSSPRCRRRASGRPPSRRSRRGRSVRSQTGRRRSQASPTSRAPSWMNTSAGSVSPCEHLPELLVVGVAGCEGLLEDRRIRGDARDGVLVHHPRELAPVDEIPRERVDPDALTVLGELLESCLGHSLPPQACCRRASSVRARPATFSGVKPYSAMTIAPGAEAPKRSTETTSPCAPTQRSQPSETPASTPRRASTSGGSTESRYSSVCSAKSSQHGQRDDSRGDAVRGEQVGSAESDRDLGAGRDEDQVRRAVARVAQHVAAAFRAGDRVGVEHGHVLAGEQERDGAVLARERDLPGDRGLVRVGGPDHPEVRNRAQGRVVLDGLVRRPVLSEADRVVRPDPDDGETGERGEPDRAPHVVAEDEKRGAVRLDHAAVQGEPVDDRAHAVLPHAEGDVAARVGLREDTGAVEAGARRLDQVGRAADHRGRVRLNARMIVAPAARVASFDFSAGSKRGRAFSQPGTSSPFHARSQSSASSGNEARQASKRSAPLVLRGRSPLAQAHVRVHVIGNDEVRVGIPAERLLRRAHLVLAERRAVRLRRVLRVRSRVGDVAANDDQRRAPALGARRLRSRRAERLDVVDVGDVLDVPAVGLEALGLVLGVEAERGRPVDRDPGCRRRDDRACRGRTRLRASTPPRRRPPSDRRPRRSRRRGGRPPRGPAGCSAARETARPSPSRPRWRTPVRAGRSWPRFPACGAPPDALGSSSPTGGSA